MHEYVCLSAFIRDADEGVPKTCNEIDGDLAKYSGTTHPHRRHE